MADLVRVPVLQGGAGASARVMRKAREKVGLREVEIDGLVRFPPPPPSLLFPAPPPPACGAAARRREGEARTTPSQALL